MNFIFGILTLRAINWYINESILTGSGGGISKILLGHFHEILIIYLKSSTQAQSIGILAGKID